VTGTTGRCTLIIDLLRTSIISQIPVIWRLNACLKASCNNINHSPEMLRRWEEGDPLATLS
jgi:hypothetical protein